MTSLLRLVGLLGGGAAAIQNYGYFSVLSTMSCTSQNTLPAPPSAGTDPLFVDRIAWQLAGPAMPLPLIANGQIPAGDPELLCMGGCMTPPCWPVAVCPPSDLWWSARYDNLSVIPSSMIALPDVTGGLTLPQTVLVLYDDVAPTPSPTPSETPSPRRTPPATPSASLSPSPTVVAGVATGSACPPLSVAEPHATPAAIALGLLLGGAIAIIGICWRRGATVECPYCLNAVERGRLRGHLDECKTHLERFTPVLLDRVRVVHGEEKEDLVARAEPTARSLA
jgi:hypothetical protein